MKLLNKNINRNIIAVFDFDGTISTVDSLYDFICYAVGKFKFIKSVFLSIPLLIGFIIGLYSRGDIKAFILYKSIGNISKDKIEYIAKKYVYNRLPKIIYPNMLNRIQKHKEYGHKIILISASPSIYLDIWGSYIGFDAILSTSFEFKNNFLTGKLESLNCWGPEKVKRLKEYLGKNIKQFKIYAYGNSRGDKEMLMFADYKWIKGNENMPDIDNKE